VQPLLTWVAVGSAVAAVLLVLPPPSRLGNRQHTRLPAAGSSPGTPRRPGAGGRLAAAAVVTGALAAAHLPGTTMGVLIVAAGAATVVVRLVRRARRQRQAEERRRGVAEFCEALLGELRAGQPVPVAVERSVAAWPATRPVASAARLGADVPAVLRDLGAEPGATGLVRLAAAWELCSATGSGLAGAVERLLEAVRVEQSVQRLVSGELASARATACLVAALPVVVLLAAQGIGGRPWQFLLTTPAGVGCLAGGVALAAGGLTWIDRIAQRAVEGG
jgi:tight adherence protein B